VAIIGIAVGIGIVVSGKRLDPDPDPDPENLRQSDAASKLDSPANIWRLQTVEARWK
jgi:hypothetical protein